MSSVVPNMYRSKVDAWLVCLMAIAVLAALIGCWRVLAMQMPGQWIFVVPTMLFAVGLPTWLMSTTCYFFEDATLVVRSGPFRWRLPIREIVKVEPTRNPLSSPALSLDRLRINYGPGKWIMISPLEREAFLADLERRRSAAR